MLSQYFYIGNGPDDYLRKNGLENYYARIENSIGSALEFLYKKDLSFFDNDIERTNFFILCSFNTIEQNVCMKGQ